MMKKFIIIIMISSFLFNCSKNNNKISKNSNTNKSYLTIFLIDVSGSFNKKQKGGFFKNNNYFDLSCNEIISYLSDSVKFGSEYILIREITNNSFEDTAFVQKINLIAKPFPPLKNPYRRNQWIKEKKIYIENLKRKFIKNIKIAKKNIINFRNQKLNKFSNKTDIIGAFQFCEFYNNLNYSFKRIIAYTDLKDNVNINSINKINLSNFSIEIRYLSREGLTKQKYKNLINKWQKILKCKNIKFKSAEDSYK